MRRGAAGIGEQGMKKAILLAAYGASNPMGRSALTGFETLCRARFHGLPVRWAFTSPLLRERLVCQRQKSDSVKKALLRLYFEKFTKVAIQPLQAIPGREYEDIREVADEISAATGIEYTLGRPLLCSESTRVREALAAYIPSGRLPEEDVILVGHGAKHAAEKLYGDLAQGFADRGENIFIGTMSGSLGLSRILPRLRSQRVWLLPLLSVVGKHALADICGDAPEAWKTRLAAAGHDCMPVLTGMAESRQIAEIWLDSLECALARLEGNTQDNGSEVVLAAKSQN